MLIPLSRFRRSSSSGRPGVLMALVLFLMMWSQPLAAQSAAAEDVITDIRAVGAAEDLQIVITTGRRPDASVFALSSPVRIVVDIAETTPGAFSSPVAVNIGAVKEIEAKEFRDAEGTITRVTIRLDEVVDYTTEVDEGSIRIRIRPKSPGSETEPDSMDDGDLIGAEIAKLEKDNEAPEEHVEELVLGGPTGSVREAPDEPEPPDLLPASEGGRNEILGLDFLPYAKYSQIRVTTAGPVRYSVHPVKQDRQLVVDLENVTISEQFKRPLDTSEFPSVVKLVSAYPLRSKPGTVRVVAKLREQMEPKVEERGNILYFEFPVPGSITAALPANPTGQTAPAEAAASSSERPPQGLAPRTGRYGPIRISESGAITSSSGDGGMHASGSMAVSGQKRLQKQYTGQPISIDVREADLHNIFRMISNVSKLNVVAGDNVRGKVTVRLVNVPWDQALEVILQAKGLGQEKTGNIVRISTLGDLKEEREARLKARDIGRKLEPLKVDIIPLNYAIASELEQQIKGALTERGRLTLDSRTNALVVEDTEQTLEKIRALTSSLDTPTPQVLIEARIVEVSTNYLRNLGIQWGGDVNAGPNTGVSTGLYFPNGISASGGLSDGGAPIRAGTGAPNWVVDLPSSNVAGALALTLGSISDIINVDVRLSALERFGEGRVISSPKVITLDNKEATISQGTRIPYETVSAAGTTVQFIEATLKLSVTPHITQDNRVFLKVVISNNRPDFGQQVNGNPAIEVKEAQTELMVRDGDTTVLGGVYTLNESDAVEGLPGLNKIPFLGWLFKNRLETSERKELLVFITPHVVTAKTDS